MSEDRPSDGLARLAERLDKAQAGHAPVQKTDGNPGLQQGLALGFRIGIELVTAVVVAGAVGWALDRWLGTRPWLMLVMLLLGIAAGMLNVYRAVAGMGMAVGYRHGNAEAGRGQTPSTKQDDEDC